MSFCGPFRMHQCLREGLPVAESFTAGSDFAASSGSQEGVPTPPVQLCTTLLGPRRALGTGAGRFKLAAEVGHSAKPGDLQRMPCNAPRRTAMVRSTVSLEETAATGPAILPGHPVTWWTTSLLNFLNSQVDQSLSLRNPTRQTESPGPFISTQGLAGRHQQPRSRAGRLAMLSSLPVQSRCGGGLASASST